MPVLTAVSSSARQLYNLLRCISFAEKAHVHISEAGIRFSVDEAKVMQARVGLEKELFTAYQFQPFLPDHAGDGSQADNEVPLFQVSINAILETLQIFGTAESTRDRWSNRDGFTSGVETLAARGAGSAFDNRTLGIAGICRITYEGPGEALCITIEEGNVTTTCELVTYEPDPDAEDIPFDREHLAQKIIMEANVLHDAISELETSRPSKMTIATGPEPPHFSLSAAGDFGSAEVVFSKDTQVLETFRSGGRISNSYKFSMIQAAARAMDTAAKVSLRGDVQGVLSLQFLVETEDGGSSFIDFAFVPLLDASDGESQQSESDS